MKPTLIPIITLIPTITAIGLISIAQTNTPSLPPAPSPPPETEAYAVITKGGQTYTNKITLYQTGDPGVPDEPYENTGSQAQGHFTAPDNAQPTDRPHYELTVWDDLRNEPILIKVYTPPEQGFYQGELKTGNE